MSEFRFKCTEENNERIIEMVIDSVYLPDVISNFGEFLRGCGFYFKGNLEIVDDTVYEEEE